MNQLIKCLPRLNPVFQEPAERKKETAVYPAAENLTSLSELFPGEEGIIDCVPDKAMAPMLGLRKGKKLRVITRQKFGGPIVVEIDGRRIALSRTLAGKIKLVTSGENHLKVKTHA